MQGMYYTRSSELIEQNPLDKQALKMLDRELAHAYAADGHGHIDVPLLCTKTSLSKTIVENLLECYESSGVVTRYIQVVCPCGETYDPSEASCMACGRRVTDASPNGIACCRIVCNRLLLLTTRTPSQTHQKCSSAIVMLTCSPRC